mmetsp:Transcript_41348/g.47641  ORF Transcript_41348/g.47641 Transcript_41348/m.47641 type:complete len:1318 (-) Transcript_41348:142-4095(-)
MRGSKQGRKTRKQTQRRDRKSADHNDDGQQVVNSSSSLSLSTATSATSQRRKRPRNKKARDGITKHITSLELTDFKALFTTKQVKYELGTPSLGLFSKLSLGLLAYVCEFLYFREFWNKFRPLNSMFKSKSNLIAKKIAHLNMTETGIAGILQMYSSLLQEMERLNYVTISGSWVNQPRVSLKCFSRLPLIELKLNLFITQESLPIDTPHLLNIPTLTKFQVKLRYCDDDDLDLMEEQFRNCDVSQFRMPNLEVFKFFLSPQQPIWIKVLNFLLNGCRNLRILSLRANGGIFLRMASKLKILELLERHQNTLQELALSLRLHAPWIKKFVESYTKLSKLRKLSCDASFLPIKEFHHFLTNKTGLRTLSILPRGNVKVTSCNGIKRHYTKITTSNGGDDGSYFLGQRNFEDDPSYTIESIAWCDPVTPSCVLSDAQMTKFLAAVDANHELVDIRSCSLQLMDDVAPSRQLLNAVENLLDKERAFRRLNLQLPLGCYQQVMQETIKSYHQYQNRPHCLQSISSIPINILGVKKWRLKVWDVSICASVDDKNFFVEHRTHWPEFLALLPEDYRICHLLYEDDEESREVFDALESHLDGVQTVHIKSDSPQKLWSKMKLKLGHVRKLEFESSEFSTLPLLEENYQLNKIDSFAVTGIKLEKGFWSLNWLSQLQRLAISGAKVTRPAEILTAVKVLPRLEVLSLTDLIFAKSSPEVQVNLVLGLLNYFTDHPILRVFDIWLSSIIAKTDTGSFDYDEYTLDYLHALSMFLKTNYRLEEHSSSFPVGGKHFLQFSQVIVEDLWRNRDRKRCLFKYTFADFSRVLEEDIVFVDPPEFHQRKSSNSLCRKYYNHHISTMRHYLDTWIPVMHPTHQKKVFFELASLADAIFYTSSLVDILHTTLTECTLSNPDESLSGTAYLDVLPLVTALRNLKTLTLVNINLFQKPSDNLSDFLISLKNQKSLKSFTFVRRQKWLISPNNEVTDSVINTLKQNKSLQHLYFLNCVLTSSHEIHQITLLLRTNRQLTKLAFTHIAKRLQGSDLEPLADCVRDRADLVLLGAYEIRTVERFLMGKTQYVRWDCEAECIEEGAFGEEDHGVEVQQVEYMFKEVDNFEDMTPLVVRNKWDMYVFTIVLERLAPSMTVLQLKGCILHLDGYFTRKLKEIFEQMRCLEILSIARMKIEGHTSNLVDIFSVMPKETLVALRFHVMDLDLRSYKRIFYELISLPNLILADFYGHWELSAVSEKALVTALRSTKLKQSEQSGPKSAEDEEAVVYFKDKDTVLRELGPQRILVLGASKRGSSPVDFDDYDISEDDLSSDYSDYI